MRREEDANVNKNTAKFVIWDLKLLLLHRVLMFGPLGLLASREMTFLSIRELGSADLFWAVLHQTPS